MATLVKMSAGFEAILFRPDAELIELARLAIDAGLEDIFMKPLKAKELMAELEKVPEVGVVKAA
jgi:hypothetical protein